MIATETKTDSSFPSGKFSINGFAKPFCRDKNKDGGGVMIFLIDDIPSNYIKVNFLPSDVKCVCL